MQNQSTPPGGGRDRRRLAGLFSLLFILIVGMPVLQNWQRKPHDSFPLSYYPMFSQDRQGKATMTYLLGIDKSGNRHFISYHRAGTGGMNQVRKVIRKRAEKDPAELCRSVAQAVTRQTETPDILLDTVKVIKGYFILDTFFAGNQSPKKSEILCVCAVDRKTTSIRPVSL